MVITGLEASELYGEDLLPSWYAQGEDVVHLTQAPGQISKKFRTTSYTRLTLRCKLLLNTLLFLKKKNAGLGGGGARL